MKGKIGAGRGLGRVRRGRGRVRGMERALRRDMQQTASSDQGLESGRSHIY